MNYEPNTTLWKRGDLVLHDADAKRADMLMIVIGFTRDGLIKTQYVNKRHRRTIYKNEMVYLHDPSRFEVKP